MRAGKAQIRALHCLLEQNGIEMSFDHAPILVHLWIEDGISQQELTNRIYKNKGAIARGIQFLEQKGFVKRKTDPNDKRSKLVSLTTRGKVLEQRVLPFLEQISECTMEGVCPEEARIFRKVLNHINEKFSI